MAGNLTGVINAHEAYSKQELMNRLGISQRFWDSMLDDGLPFTNIGHGRWVTGQSLHRIHDQALGDEGHAARRECVTRGGSDGTKARHR